MKRHIHIQTQLAYGVNVCFVNSSVFSVLSCLPYPSWIAEATLSCAAGLAETIVQSIEAVHGDLHGLLYSNIILTGESHESLSAAHGTMVVRNYIW